MLLKEWMVNSETWKDRFKNWTLTKGYNIAEGCARFSDKETLKFLSVAIGSASELETQVIISKNIGYIDNIDNLIVQISSLKKLILGLVKYLNTKTT